MNGILLVILSFIGYNLTIYYYNNDKRELIMPFRRMTKNDKDEILQ